MSKKSAYNSYRGSRTKRRSRLLVFCVVLVLLLVLAGVALLVSRSQDRNPQETGGNTAEQVETVSADLEEEPEQSAAAPDETEEQTAREDPVPDEPEEEPEPADPTEVDASPTLEEIWEDDPREPVEAKGIYLSASAAAGSTMDSVLELLDETEINTVILDVKDDEGYLTVNLDVPLAHEIGADARVTWSTPDALESLLDTLREHGAYLVARVAAFRDDVLTAAKPECSLWWNEKSGGTVYCDNQGYHWLDPGNDEVRQYLADISLQAAALGFDEIQFDYIRFPTTYVGSVATYGGTGYYEEDGVTYNQEAADLRTETITSFVEYICRTLVPQGVFVSADVYGTILQSEEDSGNVGQDYAAMAAWLDYICPMVYPSHYTNTVYGVTAPDTKPYTVVCGALSDSAEQLSALTERGEHCAGVRPWLQAFTARWLSEYIEYGGAEVRSQIDAVYDAGYSEWLLWQSSGDYRDFRSGLADN